MKLVYFLRTNSHYLSHFGRYVIVFCLFVYFTLPYLKSSTNFEENPHVQRFWKIYENTSGDCQTLKLNPFDPSILRYIVKQEPLICDPVQQQIATFSDGVLTIDPKISSIECQKVAIKHDDGVSDFNPVYESPQKLDLEKTREFRVEDEFFEVTCTSTGLLSGTIFKKTFAQIVPQQNVMDRNKTYKLEDSSPERPPIIIIGLDSMSRSNFIRQLPKTRKWMESAGFVDLEGYNKIWDNTYGNLVALLMGKTGVSGTEFDAEIDESWNVAYDQFDFVWNNFSRNGYATLFAEDRPDIATFNYMGYLKGFLYTPVTHFFRIFWLASFWTTQSLGSIPYCYDNTPKHVIQLNYLQDFIRKYHQKRHFAFWWTQDMSHDYLNVISKADDDFLRFFQQNEKFLEDSVVIVLADHGNRYDAIRETEVGRLESRLPINSIRIPEATKKRFPKLEQQLKLNQNRLVTPYDLHKTLNQFAWGKLDEEQKFIANQRANSLFSTILTNRTCKEAHVPEQYCPCFKEIPIDYKEAKEVVDVFYEHLNDLLLSFREEQSEREDGPKYYCAPLRMAQFISGSVRIPPKGVLKVMRSDVELESLSLRYRIVTRTADPSNALIEGVVTRDLKWNVLTATGEVERNNAYGNTSHCVVDPILKKICHCILESDLKEIQ